MRVYIAASGPVLRQFAEQGSADGPLEGFAATEALVRSLGEIAAEDLEFALSVAAAEASAAAIGVGPDARGRRFVVVADIDDGQIVEDDDVPGAVRLPSGVPLSAVDAILADPEDIALHSGVSDELAWFATQEIGDLLVSRE